MYITIKNGKFKERKRRIETREEIRLGSGSYIGKNAFLSVINARNSCLSLSDEIVVHDVVRKVAHFYETSFTIENKIETDFGVRRWLERCVALCQLPASNLDVTCLLFHTKFAYSS